MLKIDDNIQFKMSAGKQDPRLMEENLGSDFERYKRAVAAMKYYGARVGVCIASGDNRQRCVRSPGRDARIRGALPATLPMAEALCIPDDTYYYGPSEISEGSSPNGSQSSFQDFEPSRTVSPSLKDSQTPVVLSTKRTHSSPVKYYSNANVAEKVRSLLSTSPPGPGRTRIPIPHTSRQRIKQANEAYFAPSPPVNPLTLKLSPPSMCSRKDVRHSCLSCLPAKPGQSVNMEIVKKSERAVAEAVRSGMSPADTNIPQAALKLIPPRKSIDTIKYKTISMRQRLDELRATRFVSDMAPHKDISPKQPPGGVQTEQEYIAVNVLETPSRTSKISNETFPEIGCSNESIAKSSDTTVREESQHSDDTIKDTESKQSCEWTTQSLAESLLEDIIQRFPSEEQLLIAHRDKSNKTKHGAQLKMSTAETKNSCDSSKNENILQQANLKGYDGNGTTCQPKRACDEAGLSTQVRKLAKRMIRQQPSNELIVKSISNSKRCNTCDDSHESAEASSGYAHSTRTGLGFIAHKTSLADNLRPSSQLDTRCKTEEYDDRPAFGGSSCTCCESEADKIIYPSYSHKSIQASVPSSDWLHLPLNKHSSNLNNSRIPSMISQNYCKEENVIAKRTVSRRLLADLKRSQRMLGMVDAALQNVDEPGTSSDGMGEVIRLRTRKVNVPSRCDQSTYDMTPSPDCRSAAFGGECMRELQVLRNEHLRHVQSQMQQIVNLNVFLDKFQTASRRS